MPGRHHGKESTVFIDNSSGSLINISGAVTNVDAGAQADTAEATGFGDARKRYVVGHLDNPVTLQGNLEDTSGSVHDVLTGILGGTTPRSFKYFPAGSASGNPAFTGEVTCTSYNVTSPIGGVITWQAELRAADQNGIQWNTV